MPTINYTFTNSANYTFDASKIEVIGGFAQLIKQSGSLSFNEPYDNDTGFTYDSLKAEFISGLVRKIDQRPADVLFFTPFTNDEDPVWGNTANGNISGGAVVSGGVVDLTGQTTKQWNHAKTGNWDSLGNSGRTGTIRFDLKVNWATGNPPSTQQVLEATGSGNKNALFVKVRTSGDIQLDIRDNLGNANNFYTSAISWVNGQTYTIEIDVDTTDKTRVFVDGTLKTTFNTVISTDNNNKGTCFWARSGQGDFFLDNVLWFSTVQNTASHSLAAVPNDFIYAESIVQLPVMNHTNIGSIISLDGFLSTEAGSPKYIIALGAGNQKYWNGSAWVDSDSSYAQANDLSTMNTNLSSFTVSSETSAIINIIMQSSDTQDSVDDTTLQYTGNTTYDLTDPTITPTAGIPQDALTEFNATLIENGLDAVRFTATVGSQDKYWDGTAWSDADGSYAQTNDLATVQANLSAWNIRGILNPKVFLHSDDGTTTPSIDIMSITYDFYGGAALPENVSKIWMYIYDEENNPEEGVEIEVKPTEYGDAGDKIVDRSPTILITDSSGYAEIDLIETDSITETTFGYKFTIRGHSIYKVYNKYVPDVVSNNLLDLPDIPNA